MLSADIITDAVEEITSVVISGMMDNDRCPSYVAREKRAVARLFSLLGLPTPTKEQLNRCYSR